MQNSTSFLISGIVAFSIYFSFCFLILLYIYSPINEAINITPTTTAIELDMIEEIADKKMVEKKVEKIVEEKQPVEKATSNSNEKRPDLKSLFANVKETSNKVVKEEVNNVEKSIDPKRFKSKFEKEKKSNNVKIDKLLEDEKTATNTKTKSSSKGDKNDDYGSKIYEMLYSRAPVSEDRSLVITVMVSISPDGAFDYKFVKRSSSEAYNTAIRLYLDEQKDIAYPPPPSGKVVKYTVDFKFEG
ncbi:energy transducer TonB [Aliarcobacter cibarius]|jgi:periplasmic protein TonB|uniref:Tol-Pal system subunit TolA n=1 Tax=Aliarcobacter cibarius TaxID=255507 RepID=A0A5J6RJK7_9BACT|nr:energy transducer TonB [Aliarcobacter cibarius]QEZ89623.1 Tol-Pal system subunit TolA [Aliarcobacter cibarius]QKJ27630.1 Tol-Pal system subunit TolA [Aliarcobacter cibarius]TLT00668.1 TonB C-terminal domain-containing protein [Aliarcobacter cibarius]TLT00962.1 TonB C-terminal domain-containing protein [Aliarcobacter cibarius]TLT03894.1 TonB C-terminal domain-containing protein [Aliarcobacter cibarius]